MKLHGGQKHNRFSVFGGPQSAHFLPETDDVTHSAQPIRISINRRVKLTCSSAGFQELSITEMCLATMGRTCESGRRHCSRPRPTVTNQPDKTWPGATTQHSGAISRRGDKAMARRSAQPVLGRSFHLSSTT